MMSQMLCCIYPRIPKHEPIYMVGNLSTPVHFMGTHGEGLEHLFL